MARGTRKVNSSSKTGSSSVGNAGPGTRVAVVIGGAGFTGQYLVRRLLQGLEKPFCEPYGEVRIVDTLQPSADVAGDARVHYFQGAVGAGTDDFLREAFAGATSCFYVASTDSRTLSRSRAWRTNVYGAMQCLEFAQCSGLKAFVYTSSHNVVCDFRTPIRGADEVTSRIPSRHCDVYSASKAAAEQLILARDTPGQLRVCAIRPVGIYGPGEQVHFNRLFQLSRYLGMHWIETVPHDPFCMDWVHVESVADALLLGAAALMDPERQPLVAGKAFFITDDGGPTSVQRVFDPVLEAAGIRLPKQRFRVHWRLLYVFALMCELVAWVLDDKPLLMRMEIRKAHIAHTFRTDAARQALGYAPRYTTAAGIQAWAELVRKQLAGRVLETDPIEIRRLCRQVASISSIFIIVTAVAASVA
jgi:nucleoside-diphosphate-sugar epimerase